MSPQGRVSLRGVRKEQSVMTTVASSGLYERDAAARGEVLELLARGPARSAPR